MLAVREEQAAAVDAYRAKRLRALAWSARNLLELSIWAEYCTRSEVNARTFIEDAARDMLDLLKIPDTFTVDGVGFGDAKAEIIRASRVAGIEGVDEAYQKVAKVAEELGRQEFFRTYNKLSSKFAHPTAMAVVPDLEPKNLEGLLHRFLDLANHEASICEQCREQVTALGA